ncbi:MAG: acetyl-CoA carboxylase biotin carboxyl carrier protein [Clostridiales bacterium]|nr:acetyl-CoA carboxylase biotin carboxyl carrier protein [Clostridiales bacterium]
MKEVRRLAKILSENGLTRLEYESNGLRIALERNAPAAEASTAPAGAADVRRPEPKPIGTTVTSPLVGITYRSREPGAPPLAEVGGAVKKGDAVCIIEAMKMFSDVPAPCDGTVLEILFNDGELAEFGAPLLVIGN